MCVRLIKVPIRKKSGNLSNDPRICIYIYIYIYISVYMYKMSIVHRIYNAKVYTHLELYMKRSLGSPLGLMDNVLDSSRVIKFTFGLIPLGKYEASHSDSYGLNNITAVLL